MVDVTLYTGRSFGTGQHLLPSAREDRLLLEIFRLLHERELQAGSDFAPFEGANSRPGVVTRYGRLLQIAIEDNDEIVTQARDKLFPELSDVTTEAEPDERTQRWYRYLNFLADAADFFAACGGLTQVSAFSPPAVFGPPAAHQRFHGRKPRITPRTQGEGRERGG